jgi:hypothetical protein
MSNNYLKVGKLYSLTSTTDTTISGASFIHGIYNNHGNAVIVTINGLAISIAKDITISFSVPVALSTVKIDTGSAIIIYS